MKSFLDFIKTALIGGLLVIAPLYLALLLLGQALGALVRLLSPIVELVPAGVEWREITALVIVAGLCFLMGLAVRTGPGRRAIESMQQAILGKIPGYTVLRSIVRRVAGEADGEGFEPALVELEDALVPAFIVERLEDGRSVVLVPSVPTPAAGALYVLDAHRVHCVDVPMAEALKVFTRWGVGTADLVRAIR